MTSEQLTNEIIHYIEDQSYNYAVMIDGEWGCGKTFYVKNELMGAIERHEEKTTAPRKVKYFSLYGCNNVKDIIEDLTWSLVAELPGKMRGKKTRKKEEAKKIDKKKEAKKIIVGRIFKKSLGVLYRQIPFNEEWFAVFSDWLQTCSFVLVFDDLERCNCPIEEIFGFINGLVEHDGTKVILVANEKELCRISDKKAEPTEYLVALDKRIIIPKEDNNASQTVKSTGGDSFSIKELEERKNKLFASSLIDEEYKRKREKLIGTVLRYEPDYSAICTSIVEKCSLGENEKEMIRSELTWMDSILDYGSHHNVRTFQFFLSKVMFLLAEFEKMSMEEKYKDIIESTIIDGCYRATIRFKTAVSVPEWKRNRATNKPITGLGSIQEYVERGEYDYGRFRDDIEGYVVGLIVSVMPEDPLTLLWQEFYLHPQKWCEEQAGELLRRLKENGYPSFSYLRILTIIARLVSYGFDRALLDDAKKIMIQNVRKTPITQEIIIQDHFLDEERQRDIIHTIVNEINTEILEIKNVTRRKDINEILLGDDWTTKLSQYIQTMKEQDYEAQDVLSQTNSETWIEALKRSSPSEIDDFRRLMEDLFPRRQIRENAMKDIHVLEKIGQAQLSEAEEDLIKKLEYSWLQEQISEITNLYMQYEANHVYLHHPTNH